MLRCMIRSACLMAACAGVVHGQTPSGPSFYSPGGAISLLEGPGEGAFVDVEGFLQGQEPLPVVKTGYESAAGGPRSEPFVWQVLPSGIIYKNYLAGPKESRMAAKIFSGKHDGWLFDATLGSKVGILRYGTFDPFRPQGFQIDVEGSAQLRLDIPEEVDVRSTDYRAGVPFTYGSGNHQTKFAYYHLSSHLGDEFLLKNPGFNRLNYARDVLVLGHSIYLSDELRIYGEAGWAFYTDVSQPWEFQFGLDYAPAYGTGIHGAPFFAINGHLRQDVNYGGTLTVQTGWSWRSEQNGGLLRVGLHYLNGESNHFSFYDQFEQQIGFGIWYDN